MVDPVRKTYAELTTATTVEDTDLLASYRSTGPLKKLAASVLASYVGNTIVDGGVAVSPEQLEEAVDLRLAKADNLSDVADAPTALVNLGAASQTDFDALAAEVEDLTINSVSGVKGYEAVADLPTLTAGDEGTLAKVAGDPTPANDGVYRWDGAAWVVFDDPTIAAAEAAEASETAAAASAADAAATVKWPLTPNKFLPEEIEGTDFSDFVVTGGTLTRIIASDGLPAYQLDVPPSGSGSVYKRFTYTDLNSGKVSTSLRILSCEAAPGGSLRHRQIYRSSTGVDLGSPASLTIAGSAGLPSFDANRAPSTLADKTPTMGAFYVDWYMDLGNLSDPTNTRTVLFREILMAEGPSAAFVPCAPDTFTIETPVNLFLSAAGNDSNSGLTSALPKLTLANCVSTIVAGGGIGTVTITGAASQVFTGESAINPTGIKSLSIYCPDSISCIFRGGTQVTTWTLVSGYDDIYEATVDPALLTNVTWIYEYGVPDFLSLIPDDERHPLQRGQTYRMPDFSRIWPVADAAAIDAATRPAWALSGTKLQIRIDSGTGVLGADPNGTIVRMPSRTANLFSTGTTKGRLEVHNITIEGYRYGFWGFPWAEAMIVDGQALANGQDGFRMDDTRFQLVRPRAGANGNDDINWTGITAGIRSVGTIFDPWCHDSYDDAISPHNLCEGEVFGGLFEYSGDRGVAVAIGGHLTMYNPLVRVTALVEGNGEGYGVVGEAAEGEGGQLYLHSPIADRCKRSYSVGIGGGDNNTLTAFAPLSINAVTSDFEAQDNGIINAYDPSRIGTAATAKSTSTGGVINVYTSTPVT